jgi:hypothetical protein
LTSFNNWPIMQFVFNDGATYHYGSLIGNSFEGVVAL